MTQETLADLNRNVLVGFTEKRGNAWHYGMGDAEASAANHYVGAVPVERAKEHLDIRPEEHPVLVKVPTSVLDADSMDADGNPTKTIVVPKQKAIYRPGTGEVLSIVGGDIDDGSGYKIHDYVEWLVDTVANVLDDDLQIGSAGLLDGGRKAFVSVEVPDNLTTPEGVEYRPHLLAATSLDQSMSSVFKRIITNVVCDNTMRAGLGEKGQQLKVRHTRNSGVKLASAREALNIIHSASDDFAAEVAELTAMTVTDKQLAAFMDEIVPMKNKDGSDKAGRGLTLAENKREGMLSLYQHDTRVTPWKGTAWGVLQMVNTFVQHEGIVRGADRRERNMLRAVEGGVDTLDGNTFATLDKILTNA